MTVQCDHCEMTFTRRDNLARHKKSSHGVDNVNDNVSVISNSTISSNGTKKDDDNVSVGSNSTISSTSSRNRVNSSTPLIDETLPLPIKRNRVDYCSEVRLKRKRLDDWFVIMNQIMENKKRPEKYLKEPFLSELVDELREIVENTIEFANNMETDSVYQCIEQTKFNRYQIDHDDDAAESAWLDKRFMLKRHVIMPYLDSIKEEEEDDDDKEQEDGEDEEEDGEKMEGDTKDEEDSEEEEEDTKVEEDIEEEEEDTKDEEDSEEEEEGKREEEDDE